MKRNITHVALGAMVLAILGGGLYANTASAQFNSERHNSFIDKLVEKFNLDKDEVEEFFKEIREERKERFRKRGEARLDAAVKNGEITEEQKQLIVDKRNELHEEFKQNRETFKNLSTEEKKEIVKKKQNPEEIKEQIRQASEFEKKELFDPNQIAALIDKSKEQTAETQKKSKKLTQSNVKTSFAKGLSLSQEDALKAQIFGCWSLPLGLPYQENLLVRIKLKLKPDGTVLRSEILDHARMNQPGQGFYKVLAESALRAIRICQPLRVPPTGYEKWKDLQLNFDANEMLKG